MGEWRGCACGEGFYRERLQPRMTGERLAGYLNALSDERARAALQRCCGARRWVDAMLAARPFASDAELLATAERVWWELGWTGRGASKRERRTRPRRRSPRWRRGTSRTRSGSGTCS